MLLSQRTGNVTKVLQSQLRQRARQSGPLSMAPPITSRQSYCNTVQCNVIIYHSQLRHSTTSSTTTTTTTATTTATTTRRLPPLSITAPGATSPAVYKPPQRGLISLLPRAWVPYAELIRLDKPTGTYYLYFPCLFSTLMAASLAEPMASPAEVICTAALFFAGALVMRGAGCTINDLWDRNLDRYVERTKFRPIACKAITPYKAIVFTGFQLLTGLGILLQFPIQCLFYGIPSLVLVVIYPLAKRVTDHPQLILGLTFSWGALMGFPALGIDLLSDSSALAAAIALYASCAAWTVTYDIIYAHMDIKDDVNAGIRSMALAHQHNSRAILSGLSIVQIGLLAAAGHLSGAGPVFFTGSCGVAAATLVTMVFRVRLDEVQNCWWWFRYGCWFTGGSITAGLFGDYLARRVKNEPQRFTRH